MAHHSNNEALTAWTAFEAEYFKVRKATEALMAEAALVGSHVILDIPTRMEYMRMIRAEADHMLAVARENRSAIKEIFDHIYDRRNELRLIAQDRAKASVAILSKLLTKDRTKYELIVSAANDLAKKGHLPSVGTGKNVKSIPLEKLSPEQLDDVFLNAIDRAGGSRKSITPTKMRLQGAGLLFLTVALAGLDIYMSQDKSFAVTKNASTIAGGAGGAWALGAAGLAVGGPLGGIIGLIVGGIGGSYVAEEVHFQIRGLNLNPKVDQIVNKYRAFMNFDEDGLGKALHVEFVADLKTVSMAFLHLREKCNSDADEVASAYISIAKSVIAQYPNGSLIDSFRSPVGKFLLGLLYSILDNGWTTGKEQLQMAWLKTMQELK